MIMKVDIIMIAAEQRRRISFPGKRQGLGEQFRLRMAKAIVCCHGEWRDSEP